MFSFEKSIGGVLFRLENDQPVFLLLHYRSGHWDFPKGHQERGENDEQTIRREIEEETGIRNVIFYRSIKKRVRYFYQAKAEEKKKRLKEGQGTSIFKRVIYYPVQTKAREVVLASTHEHIGFEWLNYEEAKKRITSKNSKEVLKLLWSQLKLKLEKKKDKA